MNTNRLHIKLIKAGFDEEAVLEMERGDLLKSYAEYLFNPSVVEEAAGRMAEVVVGRDMSAEEIELRKMELERLRQKMNKNWR